MTDQTRRAFVRTCGAVVAAGTLGVTGSVRGASQVDIDDETLRREQARYVAKVSSEMGWAFDELTPLFDPPSNEDLAHRFEESYTPTVASFVPGLVGDAVELAEKLSWYRAVGDESGFAMVADRGVTESPTDDFRGANGDGMADARDELDGAVEACETVTDRADACASDPSDSNVEALGDALADLSAVLGEFEWVERWADIAPSAYSGIHPNAKQAAERVKQNAQSVLDVAEAIESVVEEHHAAVTDGVILDFPAAVAIYNERVSEVRDSVPNVLFDRIAGDSFHLRTEASGGAELTVRWFDTDSSGAITAYEVVEQGSSDADIVVDESTLADIRGADDPMSKAADAYDSGQISVSGNGFFNSMKYGSGNVFGKLVSAL
ncbi:hypothetical protein NGM10_05595 [Halorussus salilacus]|uniref:hypothetical protein n=1 Tax=Halorussus salilacus TaxID=2953750 RepID=UPI0020A1EAD0|nr:hypothetical protein [Halorussus salilacus]USZ69213.1 hypothetical protein NGM10_05595 [Halorussus salilacus]